MAYNDKDKAECTEIWLKYEILSSLRILMFQIKKLPMLEFTLVME